jgi:nitrogen regulatory protein PII
MHRLFPQKLLTIITMETLEERLVEIVRNNGASGYTIVKATGAGSSGEVSGELDVDTNIKFHVIVPQGRMSAMLDDVEALLRERHHLTVFVSDVAVLAPEKFETPLAESISD